MRLKKDNHIVNTSCPMEQVKLRSLGYAEVKETVAPLPEPETTQLQDDVAEVIEAFEPYEIEDFDD